MGKALVLLMLAIKIKWASWGMKGLQAQVNFLTEDGIAITRCVGIRAQQANRNS